MIFMVNGNLFGISKMKNSVNGSNSGTWVKSFRFLNQLYAAFVIKSA